MPVTRKSNRLSSGPHAGGKQSTLSFNHRVTKSVPKSTKDAALASNKSSLSKEYVPDSDSEPVKPQVEDILTNDVKPAEGEAETEEEVKEEVQKTEAEIRAEKVSVAAIQRYWDKIEASRRAKEIHRKHAEGLTTGEKVLKYFDVSSQYGVSCLCSISVCFL